MLWIASTRKICAVTEQNFNKEWNKKAGNNDLLRKQFIITLLVLLFSGGEGNCEINFCACDPEKSWIAGLIFAKLLKICEFEGIILAKNQRSYILIIKQFWLLTTLSFYQLSLFLVFILETNHLHQIHSPLVWITQKKISWLY